MECILFLHWRGTLFWHQCVLYEKSVVFLFCLFVFVFSLLYSSLCKHCTKQKWMKTNDKNESLSGSCFTPCRPVTQSAKAFSHFLYCIQCAVTLEAGWFTGMKIRRVCLAVLAWVTSEQVVFCISVAHLTKEMSSAKGWTSSNLSKSICSAQSKLSGHLGHVQ